MLLDLAARPRDLEKWNFDTEFNEHMHPQLLWSIAQHLSTMLRTVHTLREKRCSVSPRRFSDLQGAYSLTTPLETAYA